jgi:hypothetical protein
MTEVEDLRAWTTNCERAERRWRAAILTSLADALYMVDLEAMQAEGKRRLVRAYRMVIADVERDLALLEDSDPHSGGPIGGPGGNGPSGGGGEPMIWEEQAA